MIGVLIQGGLCNRLFQICFGYAMSIKYDTDFCFENWHYILHHSNQRYEWLLERFTSFANYTHVHPVTYNIAYDEKPFDVVYVENIFDSIFPKNNNIFARGYFQTEKYLIDYRKEILEILKEPSYVTEYIDTLNKTELGEAYFMHIRVGDYLQSPPHWVHLEKYYIRCLNLIPDNTPIYVFSNFPNDIIVHYPNIIEILKHRKTIIVNIDDEVISLYLMSRCRKGGICSNSSFSWWASWLNTNDEKKIFMPEKWYSIESNISDIHPSYVTVIPVD